MLAAAEADYEACYEAILAYDIEVITLYLFRTYLLNVLQLREASIAHDQISVPTKKRRREESSPKSSKVQLSIIFYVYTKRLQKLKLAQYVDNDDEEEAEKPSHLKPKKAVRKTETVGYY